jgi:flagellar protein FliJ
LPSSSASRTSSTSRCRSRRRAPACRDPNHFNYSLTAKSIRNRRDNLNKSIADLQQQCREARARLEESTAELHKAEALAGKSGDGPDTADDAPASQALPMPS